MESLAQYLDRLASISPTPGGGSAATIVGALAAALVAMAARITAGNRTYAQHEAAARRIAEQADALRAELLEASRRDEEAFAAVMASRGDARQAALARAAAEPLDAMGLALRVQRLAAQALELGNAHLASDLGVANELAAAALAGSAYNVRVNHRAMRDEALVASHVQRLEALERESAALRLRRENLL
ncbi:MAG: cyclodeaminase/cyclohydrolase family protein [Candidatus Tyrphobacter sp.]